MAITTIDMNVSKGAHAGKTPFCTFFTSTDLTGCEEIKAVPTGGTALYLKKLKLWTVGPGNTVTVGEGETTNAPTANIVGPVSFVVEDDVGTPANERNYAHPVSFDYEFSDPIKLTDALALTIDASAAGVVCGIVEGFST